MKTLASKLWRLAGTTAFYLLWPILWLLIRWKSRTRVVIYTNNEVLLVKGWLSSGRYSFPGGGLRFREKPVAGAIREVREETGLKLEAEQIKPLIEVLVKSDGLVFKCVVFTCYLPSTQKLHPRWLELTEASWVPVNSGALKHDTTEETKQILGAWQSPH